MTTEPVVRASALPETQAACAGMDEQLAAASQHLQCGDLADAVRLALCALGSPAARRARPEQRARAELVVGNGLRLQGRWPGAHEHVRRAALSALEAGDVALEREALCCWSHVAANRGCLEEAQEVAQHALALARAGGDATAQVVPLNYLGVLHVWAERWDEAHALFEQSAACATGARDVLIGTQPRLNRACLELYRTLLCFARGQDDRLPECARQLDTAIEVFRTHYPALVLQLDRARELPAFTAPVLGAGMRHLHTGSGWWQLCQMVRDAAAGQVAQAEQRLAQIARDVQSLSLAPTSDVAMYGKVCGSMVLAVQGRHAAARLAVQEAQACLEASGRGVLSQLAALLGARIEELAGQPEAAVQVLRQCQHQQVAIRQLALQGQREVARWREAVARAAQRMPARQPVSTA